MQCVARDHLIMHFEYLLLTYLNLSSPAVLYNKNVQDPTRLNTIKSFVNFEADLIADALPQYMYITPNMRK